MELDLAECPRLRFLPDSLGALRSLQLLSLRGQESYWPAQLPDCMGQLHDLQELDLSGLVCLTALPESLRSLPRLKRLCLSRCVPQAVRGLPSGVALPEILDGHSVWATPLHEVPVSTGGADPQQHCLRTDSVMADDWQYNMEQHVSFVSKLSKELSGRSRECAVEFPLAEDFRLGRLPGEVQKRVEDARR